MLKIPTDIFSASVKKRHNKPLQTDERRAYGFWAHCEAIPAPLAAERQAVPRDCVARNRGADFVQYLAPPRSARRNKALDPTALVGCPHARLLPSAVLAGQRRD
jgi:hypothetical protein